MTHAELRAFFAASDNYFMPHASMRPRMPSPPEPSSPGDDFGREGAPETEDAAEARERWEAER